MSAIDLRKKLIDKIEKTNNEDLLSEAFRLFEIESDDIQFYVLNDLQKSEIQQARKQIKNGQYLTDEEANKEINEWLKK